MYVMGIIINKMIPPIISNASIKLRANTGHRIESKSKSHRKVIEF